MLVRQLLHAGDGGACTCQTACMQEMVGPVLVWLGACLRWWGLYLSDSLHTGDGEARTCQAACRQEMVGLCLSGCLHAGDCEARTCHAACLHSYGWSMPLPEAGMTGSFLYILGSAGLQGPSFRVSSDETVRAGGERFSRNGTLSGILDTDFNPTGVISYY